MEEMINQGAAEAAAEETTATDASAIQAEAENIEQPATAEGTPNEETSTPDENNATA
jgi:hypothetical protein